ncbi:TonB-dependent receptor [Taibaiella sp. KBW10]|uniref:TonB-dependent receptor plug domain-containing protein n=1 Tax=Taibaiella sp. KBW10 TaxID=2153357 RepID=UPI000F5B756D|nr:TonB-dependent receptor [Taibaiella sp. KBW10]RQO30136.1 TonB-dependent receptor [Taibaiella sp. KBW10]
MFLYQIHIKSLKQSTFLKRSIGMSVLYILIANLLYAQNADTAKGLDEVVVTAQYQPQSLRKSVYKMQVIDQKKIQARAATNVQQILSGELGIRFSNDMALGTADINLMGISGKSIKVLMDGVPVLDRGEMRESLNQINAAQIERIEIIEGPMSTMYGSDAAAGVINIITKKPKSESFQLNAQVLEETAGKEYNAFTNKGLHTQQLSASWAKGNWNAMLGMLHYDFGGYGADSIGRNHSWKPKEQWIPSLSLGYRKEHWNLAYRNDYLLETIYAKGAINTDIYKATTQTFTTNKIAQQLQFNYNWNPKWSWNSSLSYTDYKRYTKTELIDYNTRTKELTQGEGQQDTAKFKALNFRGSLLYVLSTKLSLQPGIEYSLDAANGARIKGHPVIHNYAAFLSLEYKPTDKINIRPGFRVNKNSLYEAPPVLPSLNTLYRINNNISVRLSYAQGFRAPGLRELYFTFQDANHNLNGNPNLKAEYSHSFNGSFAYRKPVNEKSEYSTEVAYFYNTFRDLITLAPDPNDSRRYIYFNIAKNRTTGISLANKYITRNIEWRIGGLLLGQYNLLLNEEDIKDPNMAKMSWSPEFNVEMMYQILCTKTKINLFYKFTGRRETYAATTSPSGEVIAQLTSRQAYCIADLNVQQQLTNMIGLTAGVRNLLNVNNLLDSGAGSGSVHGGGSNLIPFSYGRSFFLSLNFNFNNQLNK